MAGRKSYDGTLLSVTGQGAAVDGDWWEVLHGGSSERVPANIRYVVSLTAGTGTWVLEGRNGPNDQVIQIDTGSAAKTGTCPRMRQFRFRWTAAAGLTGRCSLNAVLKNTTYTPFAAQQSAWYQGLIGGYWPSAEFVTPDFEHWLVEDGMYPRIAPVGVQFVPRGGSWLQFNAGGGTISRSAMISAFDAPGAPDEVRGSWLTWDNPGGTSFSSAGVDAGASPSAAVLPTMPLTWKKFVVGSAYQGWERIAGRLDIHIQTVTLNADQPDRLFGHVYFDSRCTPGQHLRVYLSRYNDDVMLAQADITTNGTEQHVDIEAPITFTAGEISGGAQLAIKVIQTTIPVVGSELYLTNLAVGFGSATRSVKYTSIAKHSDGTDFGTGPGALAIHAYRGLRITNVTRNNIPVPGDVGQSTQWAAAGSSGWTTTDSGVIGPDGSQVPVGNVDRNWKRQVVTAGGVQVMTGVALPQDQTGQPGSDSPSGTAKGKRVRIHFFFKKDGANALPANGQLQFEISDSVGTKTGLLVTRVDEIDSSVMTAYAEVTIDAANTATTFTVKVRNVSGGTLQFLEARRAIEREGYLTASTRNFVPPDSMDTPQRPRITHEANPIIQDMTQHRVESPSSVLNLPVGCVAHRWYLDWDLNDLAGRPNEIWRKLCDSGPQASSLATFLASIHVKPDGTIEWQSYIANAPDPGYSHILEFPLSVGIIQKNAFNDFAWKWTSGRVTDVYINGTWFSDFGSIVGAVDSYTPGPDWSIGTAWYYGMDRDYDCAMSGWLRAAAVWKTSINRASIEGYFSHLTTAGVGTR